METLSLERTKVSGVILVIFLLNQLFLPCSSIINFKSRYSGSVLRVLSLFKRCTFLLILDKGDNSNHEVFSFLESGKTPRFLNDIEEFSLLRTVKLSSSTRYGTCHCVFIDLSYSSQFVLSLENVKVEIFVKIIHAMVLQNLNPTHIFIQFEGISTTNSPLTSKIANILPYLTVTSEFLEIIVPRRKMGTNLSSSSIVLGFCLTCNNYTVEIPPLISHLDALSAWFRSIHSDMNGLQVQYRFPIIPSCKCGLYQKSEPAALPADFCANNVLGRHLNYSSVQHSSGVRVIGEIYSHLIMDSSSIEVILGEGYSDNSDAIHRVLGNILKVVNSANVPTITKFHKSICILTEIG